MTKYQVIEETVTEDHDNQLDALRRVKTLNKLFKTAKVRYSIRTTNPK